MPYCIVCNCIQSCSPVLSREDAIAFGAICILGEIGEAGVKVEELRERLCGDHQHKFGLLRSVGCFDKPS